MNNFLEILKKNKINVIVFGDSINIDVNNGFNVVNVNDVRSAAFYAFGESKILNDNVILFVNGDYLSNVYTVLTEAWFQKTNLVVVALFDNIYDVETNYLNRCCVGNIKILEQDITKFEGKINTLLNKKGPKVISIVLNDLNEKKANDYEREIQTIKKILAPKDEVICYNSNKDYKEISFTNIVSKYKYGIVSKYCAMITEKKNKCILLCDESCIKIDSNIFNNRYLNNNLKIIVKTNDSDFNIRNWIESNDIIYVEDNVIGNHIKDLYYSEKPMILVIKGGK